MKRLYPATLYAAVLALTIALLPPLGRAQSSKTPSAAPSSHPAAAAQSPGPVTVALRASLKRSSRIMAAAAEEMPAAKYSYQPTPGSRTFGALVLHISNANRAACHWLTGAPPAPRSSLTASSPKAQLVASLKSSFAYCSQSLETFNDSRLAQQVPFYGGRKLTAAASALALAADWADHYSQEAAYLRANGLLPPTAHHGRP